MAMRLHPVIGWALAGFCIATTLLLSGLWIYQAL